MAEVKQAQERRQQRKQKKDRNWIAERKKERKKHVRGTSLNERNQNKL